MAISRVEIKDFLVFKDEFALDFSPGVNVLIGGNGTGKTTIIRTLYAICDVVKKRRPEHSSQNPKPILMPMQEYFPNGEFERSYLHFSGNSQDWISLRHSNNTEFDRFKIYELSEIDNAIYFPEKDILEHSRGLLPFIESKYTGFGNIYRDILIKGQDIPTKNFSKTQRRISEKTTAIIDGYAEYNNADGNFYIIKTDGRKIPFSLEASGHKKIGLLGILITSGLLEPGTVLFWDEPENSLNPELVPVLVDILLELSRNGVQIFIGTHSELLAAYLAVSREKGDTVMFTALYKDGDQIKANTSNRFDLLEPNNLTSEPVRLYEKELEKGLGR